MRMKSLEEYKRRNLKNYGLAMPCQMSCSVLSPLAAFDQNRTCQICGNDKVSLNEAVLNAHSIHFAK